MRRVATTNLEAACRVTQATQRSTGMMERTEAKHEGPSYGR